MNHNTFLLLLLQTLQNSQSSVISHRLTPFGCRFVDLFRQDFLPLHGDGTTPELGLGLL